jgi:hypothetical protein
VNVRDVLRPSGYWGHRSPRPKYWRLKRPTRAARRGRLRQPVGSRRSRISPRPRSAEPAERSNTTWT